MVNIWVMKLRDYLDQENKPVRDFAEAISVSVAAMHRYLAGQRKPRPEVMSRIAAETKGAVQPNDFFAFAPTDTPDRVQDKAGVI